MAGSLTALLTDGTLQASPEKFNPSDLWKDTLPLYSEAVGAEPPLVQFAAPTSPAMGPATQLERLRLTVAGASLGKVEWRSTCEAGARLEACHLGQ